MHLYLTAYSKLKTQNIAKFILDAVLTYISLRNTW